MKLPCLHKECKTNVDGKECALGPNEYEECKRKPIRLVPYTYRFHPRNDITAFELAEIWEKIGIKMGQQVLNRMRPQLKRHFLEVEE